MNARQHARPGNCGAALAQTAAPQPVARRLPSVAARTLDHVELQHVQLALAARQADTAAAESSRKKGTTTASLRGCDMRIS